MVERLRRLAAWMHMPTRPAASAACPAATPRRGSYAGRGGAGSAAGKRATFSAACPHGLHQRRRRLGASPRQFFLADAKPLRGSPLPAASTCIRAQRRLPRWRTSSRNALNHLAWLQRLAKTCRVNLPTPRHNARPTLNGAKVAHACRSSGPLHCRITLVLMPDPLARESSPRGPCPRPQPG
jgi:hypothetical protein